MKRIKLNTIRIIVLLLFFLTNKICSAEFDGHHSWLLLPISSRAAALGQGVVAVIDNDITSFSNPGGVVFLNDIGFSYSYCMPYNFGGAEIKYQSFSINKNVTNKIKTGFTCQYYNDDNLGGNKDYSIGILYSQKIKNIGIGIKTKINSFSSPITTTINNPSIAFDLGLLYTKSIDYGNKIKVKNISLGASLSNVSYGIKYRPLMGKKPFKTRTYGLPYTFKIGYSITLKSQIDRNGNSVFSLVHTLEYMDVLNTKESRFRRDIGSGLEFVLYEMLFFRLGYRSRGYISSPRNGFTYGLGMKIDFYHFFRNIPISFVYDYAQYPWSPDPVFQNKNFKIHSFNFQYNL